MEGVEVAHNHDRRISPEAAIVLHRSIGWWPNRTEDDFRTVLATGPAVGAWADERLVGFARGISDGRLHGYIDDVMVHPDWRRQGIGTALTVRLAESMSLPVITLFCASELVPLYVAAGFAPTSQVILHRTQSHTD